MEGVREHRVILTKTAQEEVVEAVCGDCGYVLTNATAYHPPEFCILWEAKHDPIKTVKAARHHIPEPKVVRMKEEAQGG